MDTSGTLTYVRTQGVTGLNRDVDTGPKPQWRVIASTLVGYALIASALWAAHTYRATWTMGPKDFRDLAPYAMSIVLLMGGLIALSDCHQWAKRLWRTILGGALLLAGLAMLLLPGPGLVTIGAGLLVLSREYDWARRRYEWVQARLQEAKGVARARIDARRDVRREADRTIDLGPDLPETAATIVEEERRIA